MQKALKTHLASHLSDLTIVGDDRFKAGMRKLVAGVTVVTTASNGRSTGMTATAVSSLSASPPSLLVCANQAGSFAAIIREGSPFCVNLLAADQVALAKAFGGGGGGEKSFNEPEWLQDEDGVPYLPRARARFHCTAFQIVPVATHLIVAGLVRRVEVEPSSAEALAYSDGNFRSIA
ncbi:flavin reductase family protein [Mesorhizobium sp. M0659]|uniref:flavin reductase family protein n=1 Tax=Mesorhizobium sp. M0659 TaxID=2956980 RepID=UPI00333BA935